MERSKWIKLELELIARENDVEIFNLSEELLSNSVLFVNLKNFKPISESAFNSFLAYSYQMRKALAKIRENILNSNLNVKIKAIEGSKLAEDLEFLSVINKFALLKGIEAEGSTALELGLSVVKTFNPLRQYLLLNIFLETIYRSNLDYLIEKSNNYTYKKLFELFDYNEKNKIITNKVFEEFITKEKISVLQILDAVIGSELLISSFKLSEDHIKNSFFELIGRKLDIEEINEYYKNIDASIEESLRKLGFSENEVEKLSSKFMFLERRLC
jgi:hypothetical protein